MATVLERKSMVTVKGQTTIPKPVRDALGVSGHGEIGYRISDTGEVSLFRAVDDSDPAMESFLSFLERNIATRPQNIRPVSLASIKRAAKLIEGVELGEDEEIRGKVEL
jgi:antitoxin PrlF